MSNPDDNIVDIRRFTRGNLAVTPDYADGELMHVAAGDTKRAFRKRTAAEQSSGEHRAEAIDGRTPAHANVCHGDEAFHQ